MRRAAGSPHRESLVGQQFEHGGLDPAARCVRGESYSGPRRFDADLGTIVLSSAGVAFADVITGTRDDDDLVGTQRSDVIRALDGDDRVHGLGGSDRIDGDKGDDKLNGDGECKEDKKGKKDKPYYYCVPGKDGDDKVGGDKGDDKIWGEGGRDKLDGDKDDDHLYGGDDRDRIRGGSDEDVAYGDDGGDDIDPGSREDEVYGGGGGDEIFTRDGWSDFVSCGSGWDEVRADRRDRVSGNCEEVHRSGRGRRDR